MAKDSTKAEKLSQRNLDSFMKVYSENEDLKKKYDEAVAELCELQLEYNTIEAENVNLKNALQEYGTHGRASDGIMCERDKHSKYPCTCGFEQVLKENDNG